MDFKQIKELIKLVNECKIGEVLIENDDQSIRIRHLDFQKKSFVTSSQAPAAAPIAAAPTSESAELAPVSDDNKESGDQSGEDDSIDTSDLITIKSPMIGTFYRSSSPDKPPYVKVGDNINKEDVLCIIEAMKLFNEIESEFSGKIVKVMVENETPVEYDQPLFLIDPNA